MMRLFKSILVISLLKAVSLACTPPVGTCDANQPAGHYCADHSCWADANTTLNLPINTGETYFDANCTLQTATETFTTMSTPPNNFGTKFKDIILTGGNIDLISGEVRENLEIQNATANIGDQFYGPVLSNLIVSDQGYAVLNGGVIIPLLPTTGTLKPEPPIYSISVQTGGTVVIPATPFTLIAADVEVIGDGSQLAIRGGTFTGTDTLPNSPNWPEGEDYNVIDVGLDGLAAEVLIDGSYNKNLSTCNFTDDTTNPGTPEAAFGTITATAGDCDLIGSVIGVNAFRVKVNVGATGSIRFTRDPAVFDALSPP